MNIGLAQIPTLAFKNRRLVESSQKAGCYCCGKLFPPQEIKEYTDNGHTSLCPHCGVDAVLGDMAGFPLSEESLKNAQDYWFKKG